VSTGVYLNWARAAGGVSAGVCMLVFYFAGEAVSVCSSWWLSYWSAHKCVIVLTATKLSSSFDFILFLMFRRDLHTAWFYLAIYVVINMVVVAFFLLRDLYGRLIALRAAKLLFEDMLNACLYAPMVFFDTTPLGRIVNRFGYQLATWRCLY
jgi:ABC-type multidrug transport system fused ATPase/permease subunit